MFCWTIHLKGIKRCMHPGVTVGQKVYSFVGDEDSDHHIGVHVFNTVSLHWTTLPPVTPGRGRHLEVPSKRIGHTAVLIDYTVYIFGGDCLKVTVNGTYRDDILYAYDVDNHRWFTPETSGTVPKGRYNHSACVLGKVMFIHGGWVMSKFVGRIDADMQTNDFYKLDTTTMVWSQINSRCTAVASLHYATIFGTKMFVAGGNNSRHISVFDTETNCWLNKYSPQYPPEGCYDHSAFVYNGELYIFNAVNSRLNFNALWKSSPETSWKKVEPKGKYPEGVTCVHIWLVGDRAIFFGENCPDDLFVLDLSPSLKMLCKLAVIQYDLEQSELPHNIRWELMAMDDKIR